MIDEVRHSTIQMNLKRLYMNHSIDPAGFDISEKASSNCYAGTIGRQRRLPAPDGVPLVQSDESRHISNGYDVRGDTLNSPNVLLNEMSPEEREKHVAHYKARGPASRPAAD